MHDILTFEIVLLGNAAQMGDLLIQTLSRTTILGLGVKRSKFKLKSIIQTANGNILWTWNQGLLKNAEIMMYDSHPFISCHFCSIQLKTPVRIRRDGELLLDFDFSTIIRNITQRIQAVTLGYGGSFDVKTAMLVNEKATFITNINTYLQRKDLARYSNKKEKTLDLSGMLGVMTAEGNLNEFVPWLLAAEMIHIGRNTTFGLGQISVVID